MVFQCLHFEPVIILCVGVQSWISFLREATLRAWGFASLSHFRNFQKIARANNLSESAKKEGFAAIIAVLIMASAFLVVGWFHVLGILAFLLTIFYIVGVSIWFIFGKKMTDKWRLEKKFEKVKFIRMASIYRNSRDKTWSIRWSSTKSPEKRWKRFLKKICKFIRSNKNKSEKKMV